MRVIIVGAGEVGSTIAASGKASAGGELAGQRRHADRSGRDE